MTTDKHKLHRRDIQACALCGRGPMHAGAPIAYRLRVETYCADPSAIQREHGLDVAFGSLGGVMGPDEPLYQRVGDPKCVMVCLDCITEPMARLIQDKEGGEGA